MTLPKGSRDLRSLRVLRSFRLRTPKGTPKGLSDLRSHPVAMLLLLRKKRGKKPGMRRTYFRDRNTSGQVTDVTSGQKGPVRADMAQLPVAHAQNILPDNERDWRHFRSRHFRSCAVVRSPANTN